MNNKEVESKRIDYLCKHINEATELGQQLKDDYYLLFNKHIKSVNKKGGNKDHYDIEICHSDNTISRCEEKGTKKNIKFNKLQTHGNNPYNDLMVPEINLLLVLNMPNYGMIW